MADNVDAQIDSQFEGGGSEPTVQEFSSGDIFDKAKDHFFGATTPDQIDLENKLLDSENQDESLENPAEEEVTDAETTDAEATTEQTEPGFAPYEFKGSVLGKEVNQTFSSPEELNRALSQGLAAKTLYTKYKNLQNEMQSLREKATASDEYETFARERPRDLIDLIFDKYMKEEDAAEYVLKKFEHFREWARMSPEQREEKKKLKLADQLLKEREALETKKKEAEAAQQRAIQQAEQIAEVNWANTELRKAIAKYEYLDQQAVKDQIMAVLTMSRYQKSQGTPMTREQMSATLQRYLKPFEKLASPSAMKEKIGKAVEQKKATSTAKLQNAARSTTPQGAGQKNAGPIPVHEAFDVIKERIMAGKLKLK